MDEAERQLDELAQRVLASERRGAFSAEEGVVDATANTSRAEDEKSARYITCVLTDEAKDYVNKYGTHFLPVMTTQGYIVDVVVRDPLSWLFEYKLECAALPTFRDACRKRYKVVGIPTITRKMELNYETIRRLLLHELSNAPELEGVPRETMLNLFIDLKESNKTLTMTSFSQRIKLCQRSAHVQMMNVNLLRPYVAHEAISALGQYFLVEVLTNLATADLFSLYHKLRMCPHMLCFRTRLPTSPPVKTLPDRHQHLPELTVEQADAAADKYRCDVDPKLRTAAAALEFLKIETNVHGHGFVELDEFRVAVERIDRTVALSDVVRTLSNNDAVCVTDDEAVQLISASDADASFISALELLARRVVGGKFVSDLSQSYPLDATEDQYDALDSVLRNPITLIDGGSGVERLELIRIVRTAVDNAREILCTSPSAAAAAPLARACGRRAWHFRRLLELHETNCAEQSPEDGRDGPLVRDGGELGPFTKCPFEEVRIVVIDGMSLAHQSLLGPLLVKICRCARKLERVVFIGDSRQSSGPCYGYLWRDMLAALDEFTVKIGHRNPPSSGYIWGEQLSEVVASLHSGSVESIHVSYDDDDTAQWCVWTNALVIDNVPIEEGAHTEVTWATAVADEVVRVMQILDLPEYLVQVLAPTQRIRDAINAAIAREYIWTGDAVIPKDPRVLVTGGIYTFEEDYAQYNIWRGQRLLLAAIEDVVWPKLANMTGNALSILALSPDYSADHVRSVLTTRQSNAARSRATGPDKVIARGVGTTEDLPPLNAARILRFQTLDSIALATDAEETDSEPVPVPDHRLVPLTDAVLSTIKPASALRISDFRGHDAGCVIVVLPPQADRETRESIVTAAALARKKFICFCGFDQLTSALQNPEPVKRSRIAGMIRELGLHSVSCSDTGRPEVDHSSKRSRLDLRYDDSDDGEEN